MLRVTSFGSIWEIDLDDMRYRRWPKHEAPRENPDWGSEAAGALQDFVWHEMTGRPRLRTLSGPWGGAYARLVIPVPVHRTSSDGDSDCVSAPIDQDEYERVRALLG